MCIPKRRQPSARGLARSSSWRMATASKSTIHPARFWPVRSEMGDAEHGRLKRKDYEKELAKLHVELVKVQEWVKQQRAKICIVFEGRDGAGKGGTIKAITERVSPRVFRVVALPAPALRQVIMFKDVPEPVLEIVARAAEEISVLAEETLVARRTRRTGCT